MITKHQYVEYLICAITNYTGSNLADAWMMSVTTSSSELEIGLQFG